MTFEDMWAEYAPVIEGVAAEYGRRHHHQGADSDDFSQELALWMWKRRKWLDERRAEMDDDDAFEKFLARCLRNECEDYALDIRAQAGGQDRETAYWYTRGELERLLPDVYNPQSWLGAPQVEGGGRSQPNPAEGGNWLTTLADVSQALAKLERGDQSVLWMYYKQGWTDLQVAAALDVERTTAAMRKSRAITRLQRVLGGPRPSYMREPMENDPWRGRHPVRCGADDDD